MWKSKGISPKVASFDKLEIGLLSRFLYQGHNIEEQNKFFLYNYFNSNSRLDLHV